jgi:hypothetical protein
VDNRANKGSASDSYVTRKIRVSGCSVIDDRLAPWLAPVPSNQHPRYGTPRPVPRDSSDHLDRRPYCQTLVPGSSPFQFQPPPIPPPCPPDNPLKGADLTYTNDQPAAQPCSPFTNMRSQSSSCNAPAALFLRRCPVCPNIRLRKFKRIASWVRVFSGSPASYRRSGKRGTVTRSQKQMREYHEIQAAMRVGFLARLEHVTDRYLRHVLISILLLR